MATTRQALADRADRPDQIVSAGEVLDLRFGEGAKALSLRAAKLLHLLVAATGAAACEDKVHVLPIEQLNSFHVSLEEFVDTCRELFGVMVRFETKNAKGRPSLELGPLLSRVSRDLDDGTDAELRFQLSPVLRMVLENSNYWAVLSRRAILAFESRYALRLYEIVAIRAGLVAKTAETFDLDELRERLGVPKGKLTSWSDLRRFALELGIAEVNQLSGFEVTYEPIKRGRSVTGVRLSWSQLDAGGRAAVARELEASRVGRKARRDGTEEIVVEEPHEALESPLGPFPASGSIRHGSWGGIARSALPTPTPDLDHVAARFRLWTEDKAIPLWASGIEQTFTGFCRGWGNR
jgi:hypothetical protein